MIFSGIQPTGIVTLGNYLGVIKNFNSFGTNTLFCIVDLHALTSNISPKELNNNIKFLGAVLMAENLHKTGKIFLQSAVSEHSELSWILQTKTPLGELKRMTQFKEKAQKQDSANTGLLTYPVLMAADILLYDTTEVPVGIDQKQHLELTKNIAKKFNSIYKTELFVDPTIKISKVGAKIYSLTDPTKKMSKSDPNSKSYISIMDDEKTIFKKIKSSVTDSIGIIQLDSENQPGIFNLLQIYAVIHDISLNDSVIIFKDKNYGFLKEEVAKAICSLLLPLQNKINNILNNTNDLNNTIVDGNNFAKKIASKKMHSIKEVIGININ